MNEDFCRNLRLLCSYYKSIAEVCRLLKLNRPQFNRYLAGRGKPSTSTMRQLCDFFGVEEHEILMPHDQFQRLIRVRPKLQLQQSNTPQELPETPHLQSLRQYSGAPLDKYLGYYFEYYLSMACPGKLLRTLICIERQGDQVYYQRTERLREETDGKVSHGRYLGMVHFLTDRIFMSDYESITGNEMTQTILFPSFRNRITRLSGLRIGVSGSGERMPCCARVIYEYLGPQIDIHKALRLCGLYDPYSPDIDPTLREAVFNRMGSHDWHFRGLPI